MKVVAFLGPTLGADAARAILPVTVLPPARRGDVMAALATHAPDAIALVDGVFEQAPSVWHKEILFALASGVLVAGAASMGALRAVELEAFGMAGVGRIVEAYRAGRFAPFDDPFDGDDEVAVVHGPADIGYPASDALVDVRATLAAALSSGALDGPEAGALLKAAKGLFYKDRTFPAILSAARAAGLAPDAADRFAAFLPDGRVPQKRRDAEDLLRRIAAGTLVARPPAFRFETTLLWASRYPLPEPGR